MELKLHRVTFTGVDEKTDLGVLRTLMSERHYPPYIEFAVLWSKSRAGTEPRYPSKDLVRKCALTISAIHLCGSDAREIAKGCPDSTADLLPGFHRCQVNAVEYDYLGLARLARRNARQLTEFIVQDRDDTKINWFPGLSVLHDKSGGSGVSPKTWPKPSAEWAPDECVAYAGGLGPDNLREELPTIAEARGDGFFAIDMESKIRTDGWFDISKVMEVLKIIDES